MNHKPWGTFAQKMMAMTQCIGNVNMKLTCQWQTLDDTLKHTVNGSLSLSDQGTHQKKKSTTFGRPDNQPRCGEIVDHAQNKCNTLTIINNQWSHPSEEWPQIDLMNVITREPKDTDLNLSKKVNESITHGNRGTPPEDLEEEHSTALVEGHKEAVVQDAEAANCILEQHPPWMHWTPKKGEDTEMTCRRQPI